MMDIEIKGCSHSPGGALRGAGGEAPGAPAQVPRVTCMSILWEEAEGGVVI